MAGAFLLLFLFFRCLPCFSQSGEGTPPPPGHLPRLLLECESGSGFSSCSVWMWQGSVYTAIWSNGAIAQLSVESGDAPDLRVQRTDTSGNAAGLSATYTGRWDGNAVSDGKLTFTFKGASGVGGWTGKPTLTTVLNNPRLDYSYVNWYTTQLTGFAIYTHAPNDSWIGTKINDYRVRGESPMNPGEARLFSNRPVLVAPQ
jgi:hypothetical protein